MEVEMRTRLEEERRRIASDERQDKIAQAQRHVAELLTLKCPRCGQAFAEFDGCFALTCGRCGCGFCAWCFADSGGGNLEAHVHVRQCLAKPRGADNFFGTFQQFQDAQRSRRWRAVRAFLDTLDGATRATVLDRCRGELREIG